uniref:GRAM domain-containing protein n=1 Tax=Panagrellus redivivus TaxID=6233 RepID=A0A7E4W8G6_PANRE
MVWIRPEPILVGQSFWVNDCQNLYFLLQRRKGHGTRGLGSLFVATIDSVFDTRPAPFRVLYHYETDDIQVSIVIAVAIQHDEALKHWEWLNTNVVPTLASFDSEEDIRRFVVTKIEGLVSLEEQGSVPSDQLEQISNMSVLHKFHKIFELPADEKLVNYYSCIYMKGRMPHQGKIFLSVNFLCFYSFIVGNQAKIKIRWTDVLKLEKNIPWLLPQSIHVVTRNGSFDFSAFINFDEAYKLAFQLANLAMRQLIEEEGFSEDPALRNKILNEDAKKRSAKSAASFVKRDLDARQRSEAYRKISFY